MRLNDHIRYRMFLLRRWLRAIGDWIGDHTPIQCTRYKTWMLSKDSKLAQPINRIDYVPVCKDCYYELYLPFSTESRNAKN